VETYLPSVPHLIGGGGVGTTLPVRWNPTRPAPPAATPDLPDGVGTALADMEKQATEKKNIGRLPN
jgi:hypothetical protein